MTGINGRARGAASGAAPPSRLAALVMRMLPPSARSQMTGNAFALMLSVALTSGLGVLFWAIAARIYEPQQLGLGSALISALLALGSIAQLNADNVINRFLPEAGAQQARFVAQAYGLSAGVALVVALAYVATVERFVPELHAILASPLAAAWFVVAVVLWTVFALQDIVLASLQRSLWVPVENAIYAIVKIVLLPVLAAVVAKAFSLFIAWTLLLPGLVLAVNALLFGRYLQRSAADGATAPAAFFAGLRVMGWDYAGRLAEMAMLAILPVLIVRLEGAAASAKFHLAWTIAYSIYLVGAAMSRSMLAAGAARPDRVPALAGDATLWAMVPVVTGAAAALAGGYWIMGLFGAVYAEGATAVLRLLAVDSVLASALALYLAVARLRNRFGVVAAIQIAHFVLALALSIIALPRIGIAGAAAASLASHAAIWAALAAAAVLPRHRAATIDFGLCLGTSVLRLLEVLGWSSRRGPLQPRTVIVKSSHSSRGEHALQRNSERLAWLKANRAAWSGLFLVPDVVAELHTGGATVVAESDVAAIPGESLLWPPAQRAAAIPEALRAIAAFHRNTAMTATIGSAWIGQWLDAPLAELSRAPPVFMSSRRRDEALAAFRKEQLAFWQGRRLPLGWCHGDYWPGNLFFRHGDGSAEKQEPLRLHSVVDWENCAADAPAGFDSAFLLITCRALVEGEEAGSAVAGFLRNPRWSAEERAWIAAAAAGSPLPDWVADATAARAVVGLAWLHLVSGGLRKEARAASNRFWLGANVERVLATFLDG